MNFQEVEKVLQRFAYEGNFVRVEELNSGNINNTYHIFCKSDDGRNKEYILQQINIYVFKKPYDVMSNIQRITSYLAEQYKAQGEDPKRRVLTLIPVRTGEWMYHDEQDRYWRMYLFITNAHAYDRADSPELFEEAGAAFGEFQRMLMDFPANELFETIPNFHNTRSRFYDFVASVAADPVGRVKDLEKEIDFIFDRRKMMSSVVEMLERGELPLRVTHNDTKINNVMLDAETGKGICVIDLDTVMPGSVLYDFGDAIRFGASTAAEDEPDTSKIALDIKLFEAFTKGFVSQVNGALNENEIRLLPLGAMIMTCELALRFLKDYIDGDPYFKIKSPDHNLIRARAQMKLLEDIESKYEQLCSITEAYIK